MFSGNYNINFVHPVPIESYKATLRTHDHGDGLAAAGSTVY